MLGMEQKKQRPCPEVKVVAWGPAGSTVVWKVGVASAHPQHLSGYFALHPLILNFHHIPKPITHPHRHTNSKRVRTHTRPAAAVAAKSLQSCPTLCDPIDSSPRGSPIPGILQARTLEWFAISFSDA